MPIYDIWFLLFSGYFSSYVLLARLAVFSNNSYINTFRYSTRRADVRGLEILHIQVIYIHMCMIHSRLLRVPRFLTNIIHTDVAIETQRSDVSTINSTTWRRKSTMYVELPESRKHPPHGLNLHDHGSRCPSGCDLTQVIQHTIRFSTIKVSLIVTCYEICSIFCKRYRNYFFSCISQRANTTMPCGTDAENLSITEGYSI